MMAYMDSDSRNLPPYTTDNTRNEQMPTKSRHTQIDYHNNDHIDTKRRPQRSHPKQL